MAKVVHDPEMKLGLGVPLIGGRQQFLMCRGVVAALVCSPTFVKTRPHRPAAIAVQQGANLETAQSMADLQGRSRQQQRRAVVDQLGQNAVPADHQDRAESGVMLDADEHLSEAIDGR